MTKYIPTDEQLDAFEVDHSTRDTAASIVRMIATGRGIDRVTVRRYVAHDVDTTGANDTVGVFFVDLVVKGEKLSGHATFAFNLVDGVPIAADFRDFRLTVST